MLNKAISRSGWHQLCILHRAAFPSREEVILSHMLSCAQREGVGREERRGMVANHCPSSNLRLSLIWWACSFLSLLQCSSLDSRALHPHIRQKGLCSVLQGAFYPSFGDIDHIVGKRLWGQSHYVYHDVLRRRRGLWFGMRVARIFSASARQSNKKFHNHPNSVATKPQQLAFLLLVGSYHQTVHLSKYMLRVCCNYLMHCW